MIKPILLGLAHTFITSALLAVTMWFLHIYLAILVSVVIASLILVKLTGLTESMVPFVIGSTIIPFLSLMYLPLLNPVESFEFNQTFWLSVLFVPLYSFIVYLSVKIILSGNKIDW